MRIRFFTCLILLCYLFTTSHSHAQSTNPCGVVAGISPAAKDSVMTSYASVNFSSTSINATSVSWLHNGIPTATGSTSYSSYLTTGLHVISLVAYNGNCTDTTTVVYFYPGTPHNIDTMLLAHYGTSRYNEESKHIKSTLDSGFILAGTQYIWDPCGALGVLVKLRERGCIDWSKKLKNSFNCPTTEINALYPSADTNYYLITGSVELVKLDKNGNHLWTKRYYSNQSPLYFNQITGDNNGNLYLTTGGSHLNSWTLTKLDGNGNVIWNKYFRLSYQIPGITIFNPPYEYAVTTGIVYLNGKLYVAGNAYNDANGYFSFINKFNPVTGALEWKYGYKPNTQFPEAYGFVHLSTYDTLLMEVSAAQGATVTLIDPQGNVKKNIKTQFSTSFAPKATKAVAGTNGRIFVMQWTEETLPLQPGYQYHNYIVQFDTSLNKYGGMGVEEYQRPWFNDLAMGLDNHPAAIGTKGGLVVDPFFASRDLHYVRIDSMVADNGFCYGVKDLYTLSVVPISRFNYNYLVDSLFTAAEGPHSDITVVDAFMQSRYNCPDFLDSCSYLVLSGPKNLCDLAMTYTYRVHRNRACALIPQWIIPPDVTVMNQTDTTVDLRFAAFGNYTISASINGCIPAKDSLLIKVASRSYPLDLGRDTTLCEGTTIKLRAATNFFSYLWNDGSTDSTLNISQPGLYWVETIDSCNNVLRDSITVTSFYFPINIGPDRFKCNNDTLHLSGPPGFISYSWSNNYNISSANTQNTVVNPLMDTVYYLKAEKLPGCFSYDTVRITVKHSPPIGLGADAAICKGDSLLLDAGTGFIQYSWNNGMNTQQVFVRSAGTYSVIGFTTDGCRSYDTLILTKLFDLPVISLDHDPALCIGDTRILDAGPGYTSYNWNTGSNSQTITVNNTGQYAVSVIDQNNCKGADTTIISQMLPPPVAFLGADTAICSYGDLQLKALLSFDQYTWSTGSSSSVITIKQPGIYWLQVKDGNGCVGKDTVIVNPKECLKGFFMPTGFTPNNDGKNDLLRPILLGDVKQYRFWIYNRWGELIFETNDLSKGWNGTHKGQPQSSGVFVWMCVYQFNGEAVKQEKGTTVLIR